MGHVKIKRVMSDGKIECEGSGGFKGNIVLEKPDNLHHAWRGGKRVYIKRDQLQPGDIIDHPSFSGTVEDKYYMSRRGKVKPKSCERERKRWVKRYMDVKLKLEWVGSYIVDEDGDGDPITEEDIHEVVLDLIDKGLKKQAATILQEETKTTQDKKKENFVPTLRYSNIIRLIMKLNVESDIGISHVTKITADDLWFTVGKSKEVRDNFTNHFDKTKKSETIKQEDIIEIYNLVGEIEMMECVQRVKEIDLE